MLEKSGATAMKTIESAIEAACERIATTAEMAGGSQAAFYGRAVTGFPDLDVALGGIGPGEVALFSSLPGVGKTSFALNVAVNAAKAGWRVLLFEAEMDSTATALSLIASEARVSLHRMTLGLLDENDWICLVEAVTRLRALHLAIYDSPEVSRDDLSSAISSLSKATDKTLVVIDGTVVAEEVRNTDKASNGRLPDAALLKRLAREQGVPIVVTADLPNSYGQLIESYRSFVREPRNAVELLGGVGRVVDIVVIIDRALSPDEAELSEASLFGVADFVVVKHRSASIGAIKLAFVSEYRKFFSYAEDE